MAGSSPSRLDLTIVVPALDEGENLALLLPRLRAVLSGLGLRHEILVVTRHADPVTEQATAASDARLVLQDARGYGGALVTGFTLARGDRVLTMDADLSHPAGMVTSLWEQRARAEVVIASRYVPGGRADMPLGRLVLSRVLNRAFSRGLSLRVRDMSSGFRLYDARVVKGQPYVARDFDILQEILVRAYSDGWQVSEVPFTYEPRRHGSSHARVLAFGLAYLRTFGTLWRLRNSLACGDYDARAYDSAIPLQRYWQRRRFRHVTALIAGRGPVLDVGCGSSRIIGALPAGSVAVDIRAGKLRYARRYGRALAQASGLHLPFPRDTFPCVVCSQMIEHVPKDGRVLDELCRVLRPGGRLVLGTPDYSRWEWRRMEGLYGLVAPTGYASDHISRYTRDELVAHFTARGYTLEDTRSIMRGELILALRKPGVASAQV